MTEVSTSRRTLLTASAATAAGLTLGACGSEDKSDTATERKPGEKITLMFWTWVPGIEKAVALWNKKNPDVQVKVEKVSPTNSAQYAKMHAALKAGNPPDLAQVEYQNIAEFLLDKGLLNLADHGAAEYRSKFVGWQWEQVVYDGGVYAIPQASGPMGMFYRHDLFRKWDIEPPATWDDYETAAKQIRKSGAYIGTFPASSGGWIASVAWQAGAQWFRTEGEKWIVGIDGEATRKVLTFWEGLVRGKLVKTIPVTQSAWYADIQSGDIVNWIGAQWGDALIKGNAPDTAGKWRAAPMPQWERGADASSNWGGSTTAVFTGAEHPKDAVDFAVWLNTDPESIDLLIKGGYGWPAAKQGFQGSSLDEASEFFDGQRYNEVFAASDKAVDTSWKWGPTTVPMFQHLTDELTEAMNGNASFTDAIGKVQKLVMDDMKEKGLKVEAA
ncbi:extracellular solute-binding protein [Streptomyces sp. N2-109]|uniref:Extracellular solute-binding protein n=1 Tax=Streptomyces gossypii TaxID=2883101 RepID=A0ABT2JXA6_9ACTN|nr:extracellular solute-binding protein [Streptomyces gossypii]MCT2592537.1 extracellular solute-binding protein [Streptomyces gossypii]